MLKLCRNVIHNCNCNYGYNNKSNYGSNYRRNYICNSRGMITIEACILIPMILMISLLIIWLGFFLYNRTLFMECAGIAAIKGSQMAEADNEEISATVRERARELLQQKTIGMEDVVIEVIVDYGSVTVGIRGSMQVPGAIFLTDIYQNNRWNLQVEQTTERLRNCTILRTIEGIRKSGAFSSNETVTDQEIISEIQQGG